MKKLGGSPSFFVDKNVIMCFNKHMETKVKIRYTNKKDLEQLPWLLKQNYREETLEIKYEDMLRVYEELNNSEDYKFISALIKDKLVGFAWLWLTMI